MEENKKGFVDWVKDHKKQLLIAGISVTAIIGTIIGLKNKEAISELWETLEKSISKTPEKLPESVSIAQAAQPVFEETTPVRMYTSPRDSFGVSQHFRKLSGGRHHSAKKAAEAALLGIDLPPDLTLVDAYTKYAA